MSRVTTQIEDAKRLHQDAIERMDEQDTKIQSLPEDTPVEERDFHRNLFQKYEADAERAAETLERLVAIQAARATAPAEQAVAEAEQRQQKITVGNEPKTYTEHTSARGQSFFRDVVYATQGDFEANERLARHAREQAEERDISTTVTAGGNFVPPRYLGDFYAEFARESRPFADVLPRLPLYETGMSITIPRITTGTTVIVSQTENSTAPAETNIVEALLTVSVRTVAGMQDVSQQLLDRSDPGIDQVIFNDLRSAYDMYLDTQLISGTGSNGQHLGIRAVTSPNTVTYTDGSPTAAETLPKLYDAAQLIHSNRYAPPTHILLHPRRSAFLASNLSSTFPLFQQGQFNRGVGSQDLGLVAGPLGLTEVTDANIGTTYGASTNEDEIYVIRASDMLLWEGPVQTRVYPEVGSGTLTVRLMLWAYSAFASGRFPKSISIVSGTGLVTPGF